MAELASRIIEYMRKKEYQIFTNDNEYNIVYVEGMNGDGTLNNDEPNFFNDRRLLIGFIKGSPKILGSWEATTEPGTHYTDRPMNPKGAARIAFGQYKAWRVGIHGNSEPHEALVQVTPIAVYRDANKDMRRTGDKVDIGLFGVNQHHGYDLSPRNIGLASGGCLVGRTRQGHKEFMKLVKQDRRYQADRNFIFTSTIIAGDSLLKT